MALKRLLLIAFAGGLSLLLAGAAAFVLSLGFVHDEVLVGPYRLVAVDIDRDMAICWSLPGGGCVGDGLPGPTVFAAGFNDDYLVAAAYPDRYYYVVRSPGDSRFPTEDEIVGPLTPAQFEQEKQRLNLPEFSRVFENLKERKVYVSPAN
jgi:hypothetical protein